MITESSLHEYFMNLATFNYAKAKHIMDHSYSSSSHVKNDSKSGLSKLISGYITILNLERKYYAFDFLINKRKSIFSLRESHFDSYAELLVKILAIPADKTTFESEFEDIFTIAKSSLVQICDLRWRMTEMYLEISQIGRNNSRSIVNIVDIVRPIKEYLKQIVDLNRETTLSMTSPLLDVIELEVDTLMCLAEAQELMSNLYFLVPINLLHSANEKCQQLLQICSPLTTSGRIFSRNPTNLLLLSWLMELYNVSLAKYSLYFHPILMQKMIHLPANNFTTYESRALEMVQRITAFVKKASVSSFLLVFDATKQNHPFLGHGYVLPSNNGDRVSGLQSYPVIFSCPMESELPHKWHCAIVMLIGHKMNNSINCEEIEYLAEPDGTRTYFLARIDIRVYLILLFEGRREKEKLILNFIENVKTDLNGKSVIDQLGSVAT